MYIPKRTPGAMRPSVATPKGVEKWRYKNIAFYSLLALPLALTIYSGFIH